jgi:hypothetical protein
MTSLDLKGTPHRRFNPLTEGSSHLFLGIVDKPEFG